MATPSGARVAHRILVVEDERISRAATERMLEVLGYDTVAVGSGAEAVANHAAGHFDAILMDCQMPGIDGFRATAAIRQCQAREGRPHTPIIGLSGRTMEGDSDAALAAGMDSYLTKPARIEALRATLEQWMEPRSSNAEPGHERRRLRNR